MCDELERFIDDHLSQRELSARETISIPGAVPEAVLQCLGDRYRIAGWTTFQVHKSFGSTSVVLRR